MRIVSAVSTTAMTMMTIAFMGGHYPSSVVFTRVRPPVGMALVLRRQMGWKRHPAELILRSPEFERVLLDRPGRTHRPTMVKEVTLDLTVDEAHRLP